MNVTIPSKSEFHPAHGGAIEASPNADRMVGVGKIMHRDKVPPLRQR